MYVVRTGLILGFHGCDQSVMYNVVIGKENLKPSINKYDWLGHHCIKGYFLPRKIDDTFNKV